MRLIYSLLLSLLSLSFIQAQANFWQDFEESSIMLSPNAEVGFSAKAYRTLSLDFEGMKAALSEAPMEFTAAAANNPVKLYLPLPNGTMELMEVVESPVFAAELQEKYPDIRAYTARSVNNKRVTARLDYSPRGFNAIVTTPAGHSLISTYATNQTRFYISYYTRDMQADMPALPCGYDNFEEEIEVNIQQQEMLSMHTGLSFRNNEEVPLRQYRLALVCTGNYGQNSSLGGGTVSSVLASYNTALNLLNAIFQVEFAVRFELIPESEDFIFLDADTDPFFDANMGTALLEQNKNFLNTQIPFNSYDIGHIFTANCTDVGGVASGTVCSENKARGVTCHSNDLNYVVTRIMAHEIGHQFSCGHSWNNCPPSEDQLSVENAFEPGSGSTIMSYQDLCGATNNIPGPFGLYYNIGSLEDAIFFARQGGGAGCGETITTDNNQPVITLDYEDGFYIPISTPFELEGTAEDLNDDPLTYCWEQYNIGPSVQLGNPIQNAPLFRTFDPSDDPKRVFPRLDKIVENNFDNTEVLPDYGRDMNFRLTVRDNNPNYGGAVWQEVAFEVDGNAGPFVVTYPNAAGIELTAGDYVEVTWDVANTTNPRVNCQYVNILLSTDGGYNYPVTLVENTPNDGTAFVSIPNIETENARIRIEASNNIFFDISNQNSAIVPPSAPSYILDVSPASIPLYCLPADPLSFDISTEALLDYDMPISLSVSGGLPAGAVVSFGQDMLNPGENTTMNIDMDGFTGRDTFNILLEGTTDDLGTFSREIRFIAVSTDFSGLAMTGPENGANGIFLSTDFSWNGIPGADSYDIEIATSPAFGSTIIETAEGLTETTYTPEELFENDEIYFWRIRPNNICGSGDFLTPFAFYTASVECEANDPNDLPISIPTAVNTKESKIFVPESGVISDVNVTGVDIAYLPINSLEISLVAPDGTTVLMYDNECLNTGQISLSFDDEAPTDIICPPISGNPMRPVNPLSVFIGDDTQGEWTLRVSVTSSGFGTGSINDWALEFCSTSTPAAPSLLTNNALEVPPGGANPITSDLLETTDPSATPSQLKYILVTVPENGTLLRASDSEPLTPGESFTQQTINSFNLFYVHDGSDTDTDEFVFIVENSAGALIPNQTFNIVIDEGAIVNTEGTEAGNAMEVFPNPARQMANLRLQRPLAADANVRMLNVQGQLVQQQILPAGQQQLEFNTSVLSDGIYFIELNTQNGILTQKLVIQK
jgi:subtilisin-like proprotein convertase family protein